ncbi:CDF family Co(II)/Ni(II) efflux transporter DmeF [Dongia soli]|uniref:CDF family Co(II)/Ni(II) efflux transporter DmeF n=1 Tax=Dongia soli TaxID=600628 RepID=A0ABU5ED39_9PROT|nr:CDF family Co(II)/Ni(II) efflux transporter DmeF [Dongia soli]MDY0883475.1 CDF family Co(II)/Ni(II) efflux transporter DmeF [Dongia soli]
MHTHSLDAWTHEHVFLGENHHRNEKRIWLVVALTTTMMVVEIAGGTVFGSLALVADGWHMSTHAAALAISALAYLYARRHLRDRRFSFGTGKLGDLASFASAVILAMIAVAIGWESIKRLLHPVDIAYGEAIGIAVVGLAVNLLSAWILRDDHGHHHHHHHHHHHDHDHQHDHGNHHAASAGGDLNLRAAYIHVLADAATSVLAIAGLLAAWFFGWRFIDPLVGLVGTAVILSWAYGLIRAAGAALLDTVPDDDLADTIRGRLEVEGDRVADQHLWRIGPSHYAAVITIVSDHPARPGHYKARLAGLPGLSHVTIEVEPCFHPTLVAR